jgi:cytochrome-b5 reductase
VTEQDILLREEFDALKQKYPKKFDVVYILDKPSEAWTGTFRYHPHFASGSILLFAGPTGYISSEIIKQHVAPATLGDKVKVFVCGALFRISSTRQTLTLLVYEQAPHHKWPRSPEEKPV